MAVVEELERILLPSKTKRNIPAIKLYKKLGYKHIWEDDSATILLPTKNGAIANGKATIYEEEFQWWTKQLSMKYGSSTYKLSLH